MKKFALSLAAVALCAVAARADYRRVTVVVAPSYGLSGAGLGCHDAPPVVVPPDTFQLAAPPDAACAPAATQFAAPQAYYAPPVVTLNRFATVGHDYSYNYGHPVSNRFAFADNRRLVREVVIERQVGAARRPGLINSVLGGAVGFVRGAIGGALNGAADGFNNGLFGGGGGAGGRASVTRTTVRTVRR